LSATETPRLTVREAAGDLVRRIQHLRAAFIANPQDLEIRKRGLAVTDLLAALDRAAADQTRLLPLLEACKAAVRELPSPGHYGYETQTGEVLSKFYGAINALAAALKSEQPLEGGAE